MAPSKTIKLFGIFLLLFTMGLTCHLVEASGYFSESFLINMGQIEISEISDVPLLEARPEEGMMDDEEKEEQKAADEFKEEKDL